MFRSRIQRFYIFISLAALFLIAAQAEPPDLTDLSAVLIWLAVGGSVVATQYFFSLLAEKWAAWHKIPGAVKFGLALVFPAVLAYGANRLLGFPELIAGLAPYWSILVQAFIGWIAGQKANTFAKMTGISNKAKGG